MKTRLNTGRIIAPLVVAMVLHNAVNTYGGTVSTNWTGSQAIPDNNASGVAFSFNLASPETIANVTISLNILGGWNGDLYAYLSHGSGFSVLLNRLGRTAGDSDGSGISGMSVQLRDSYLTDIHNVTNNPLNGNFAPDGRNVNPTNSVDTSPRTAMLGNFVGLGAGGSWTLFFADLGPAAVSTLQSWTVTVDTVPEPSPAALTGFALLATASARWSRKTWWRRR